MIMKMNMQNRYDCSVKSLKLQIKIPIGVFDISICSYCRMPTLLSNGRALDGHETKPNNSHRLQTIYINNLP